MTRLKRRMQAAPVSPDQKGPKINRGHERRRARCLFGDVIELAPLIDPKELPKGRFSVRTTARLGELEAEGTACARSVAVAAREAQRHAVGRLLDKIVDAGMTLDGA